MADILPFLTAEDTSALGQLAAARVDDLRMAFVTFASALGRDLIRDYRGANLQGYRLGNQDLRSVDLTAADLRNADLRGALLPLQFVNSILFEGAFCDDGTRAPADALAVWLRRWAWFSDQGRPDVVLDEATSMSQTWDEFPKGDDKAFADVQNWIDRAYSDARRCSQFLAKADQMAAVGPGDLDFLDPNIPSGEASGARTVRHTFRGPTRL